MRRIGLDLALRAPHRAVIYDDARAVGRPFAVSQTRDGIDKLLTRATAGVDGPCEFVMEPTGLVWIPLCAELARHGHRTYVPKPQKTFALRRFYTEFTKNDSNDAKAAALIRHVDRDGVYELHVPSAEQTSLRMFVKKRACLVNDASRCKQRIRAWLLMTHPNLNDALGDSLFNKASRAFLRRRFNPLNVRTRGKSQLRDFWTKHCVGLVNDEQVEKVWLACCSARDLYAPLHKEERLPFDYGDMQFLVGQELDAMEFIEKKVTKLEGKIRSLYRLVDPEQALLNVAGVGETIAPALEAFLGDVERFPNIKSFAKYTGLVPRTNLTGGKGKPGQRMTKAGPDIVKQYLFLAADWGRRRDPELAATYERMIGRGKHHYDAVIVVAHKLARRIYAFLKLRAAKRSAPETAVNYRLRHPDDGSALTAAQAASYVRERYPSKAAKARAEAQKKKMAPLSVPIISGSPEDATTGIDSTSPPRS